LNVSETAVEFRGMKKSENGGRRRLQRGLAMVKNRRGAKEVEKRYLH
jgi:hypothetical protein